MGDVDSNSPVLPDIDACIRHCKRLTNYWSIQPNGKCWCKKSIMKKRTRAGWSSGSTSCYQDRANEEFVDMTQGAFLGECNAKHKELISFCKQTHKDGKEMIMP